MATQPLHAPDDAPREDVAGDGADAPWLSGYDLTEAEPVEDVAAADPVEATRPADPYRTVIGGFLLLLAFAWIGVVAWGAGTTTAGRPLAAADFVRWAALASGPLALLAVAWLISGRTSRAETTRFLRGVAAMQAENDRLSSTLTVVGQRLVENRDLLVVAHSRFANLGEEIAERLGTVTRDVDAGAEAMVRYAGALDRAAGSARTDIGVLLADIPKAERQANALAQVLRDAGLAAHEGAAQLDAGVSALTVRAREADEAVAGAAGRMTAHAAQVGTAADGAAERIGGATGAMTEAVDAVLARTDEALAATRSGVDDQGRALLALVEQSNAALEGASAAAGRNLRERVEEIAAQVARLGADLDRQDESSGALIERIRTGLDGLDRRLAEVGAAGEAESLRLGGSLADMEARTDALDGAMRRGGDWIDTAAARTKGLQTLLDQVGGTLGQTLPDALEGLERQVHATGADARALRPEIEGAAEAAAAAGARLADAEGSLARQRAEAEALLAGLDEGVTRSAEALRPVQATLQAARTEAESLAHGAAPELLDALARVRDAANQAASHAREAIAAAIPESADRLSEAAVDAIRVRLNDDVAVQMEALAAVAERATEAARGASERLTRQMLAIGEAAAAVEGRISEHETAARAQQEEGFPRQSALLIESLNSLAIDVAKILSNDVTDSAWASYLKGDRGIFTRRAVRLIDTGEAREIVRHYEAEPEFREQVNRYVHDFEALLRRILAEPGGSPLGVTLLGSDVGKLYVALAQAIERLRR